MLSKPHKMLSFSDRVLHKPHNPKRFCDVCKGWHHRVQWCNPGWAKGQSCMRKGCWKPCWGRDASTGSSCISAPALTPCSCPRHAAALAHIFCQSWPPAWSQSCSILMPVVTVPILALLTLPGAVGRGHGERSLSQPIPLSPCCLPGQHCSLTLSLYSKGTDSMQRHSQQLE